MDQLKQVLAWIKAQHFWLLVGIAILVCLGGWFQGSSQLKGEIASNKQKINSEFQNAGTIRNRGFHPNTDVNRVQANNNRQLAAKVRELWMKLHDRQVREVLKWPPQLREDFRRDVARLQFGDEIVGPYRDDYLNYIQKRFPDLPKIIHALELPEQGGARRRGGGFGGGGFGGGDFDGGFGGGMGGGMRLSEEALAAGDFLVIWHDQERVREQLNYEKRPSSLEIWVTQENLWVYETLLRAIAATNAASGADRHSNAAIRDIWALEVGRDTQERGSAARVFVPQAEVPTAAGGEFSMDGDFSGMDSDFGDGGGYGDDELGAAGEGDPKLLLLAGRYLNETGAPMASPIDGAFSFGREYKRLPVRLVLRMDQRWLPRLLTELANAPLQVEAQEVRIDPEGDAGTSGGRGGTRRRRSGFGEASEETLAFNREPQVREQIVIKGVVYIFYPPDESVLEVPTDGADLAADL